MDWDTNHDGLRQIFCAAISGITANPAFFGAAFQQSPKAAVEFADEVVKEALKAIDLQPSKVTSATTAEACCAYAAATGSGIRYDGMQAALEAVAHKLNATPSSEVAHG